MYFRIIISYASKFVMHKMHKTMKPRSNCGEGITKHLGTTCRTSPNSPTIFEPISPETLLVHNQDAAAQDRISE